MGALVVRMPALKDHIEDLPELVDTMLPSLAAEIGVPAPAIPPADLDRLMGYSWPGRQLN
jgi:DNA-binding NtrC family response regulator